ncbi:MAG: nuclear transport factor 2 family protein [Flavobacterium sp.]|nr:nuclear transport factor 2 family protein [Flavobacterium sp.]
MFLAIKKRNNKSQAITSDSTAIQSAKQLFQKFNAHDWAAMAALYADTTDFKDPSLGIAIVKQSRAQTIQKYTELNKVFTDIKDSVVAMYPINNTAVVVEFISKGTAPNGSKFELPICSILTVNDKGLIEKDYTYYDNSANK